MVTVAIAQVFSKQVFGQSVASLLPLTYDLITKVNTTIQVMNSIMEPYGNTGIRGGLPLQTYILFTYKGPNRPLARKQKNFDYFFNSGYIMTGCSGCP